MGEWISVKDRLPNVAGWYLVFYNGSAMQVAFFMGKKWPFDNHYHKITHWMPLPGPPVVKESLTCPCKWCLDEMCVNDMSPACADFCPLDSSEGDRWSLCRLYEPKEETNG